MGTLRVGKFGVGLGDGKFGVGRGGWVPAWARTRRGGMGGEGDPSAALRFASFGFAQDGQDRLRGGVARGGRGGRGITRLTRFDSRPGINLCLR